MGLGDFLDTIPVIGHVKGVFHYLDDDEEAGDRAMLAASRTTTVVGAAAVGMLAGPVGAGVLAAEAGAGFDLITAIASDGHHVKGIARVAKNPKDPNAYIAAGLDVVGDAAIGGVGGAVLKKGIGKAAVAVGGAILEADVVMPFAVMKIGDNFYQNIHVEQWSTAKNVCTRAVAGDLIEFRRLKGIYCHWAVYIGDGYVINYGRKNPRTSIVQRERLTDVADGDEVRINNLVVAAQRRNLEPFSGEKIVRRAKAELGQESSYDVIDNNCEIFATKCRYGRGFTTQPEDFMPLPPHIALVR